MYHTKLKEGEFSPVQKFSKANCKNLEQSLPTVIPEISAGILVLFRQKNTPTRITFYICRVVSAKKPRFSGPFQVMCQTRRQFQYFLKILVRLFCAPPHLQKIIKIMMHPKLSQKYFFGHVTRISFF